MIHSCLNQLANRLWSSNDRLLRSAINTWTQSSGYRFLNIAVEGNIGSGKSTLLKRIQQKGGFNVSVFNEPIERWRNVDGQNLCKMMYEEPCRWGFTFQNFVQLTMAQRHAAVAASAKQRPQSIHIMERSLLSARFVFVENLYRKQLLNQVEYTILDQFALHMFEHGAMDAIDLIVYLRIEPEQCLQRIRQRARPEERVLDLDTLKFLHNLHEQLLLTGANGWPACLKRIPILQINSNDSVDELVDLIQSHQEPVFVST